ncbi:MAG: aminotransferase class I/II-fold pyridoxal phosphate-dependent enzyme, partial [Planctomycetota bacterium]
MPADPIDTRAPARVTLSGRTLTAFGGCDYLALSRAPAVLDAVREGLDRYGLSVTASRETTGNTEAHEQLERAVRVFFDPVLPGHDVLLCPDGYIANLAAAQSLRARGVRRAWLDAHAHKSLEDAAHAAGLPISRYPHQETPSFVDAAT